jgi:nicotinamidase-related amidase
MATALAFGPLPKATVHLCVDMQTVFYKPTDWHVPWMKVVLPAVVELASRHSADTIFTRFRPPPRPNTMLGGWQRYYGRWPRYTIKAQSDLLELVPELAALAPPATVIDKAAYSAFVSPQLRRDLFARRAECLVITGVETDVCVMATVLGAIDGVSRDRAARCGL